MAVSFKGAHCPQEIILTAVRWYVAYPLSRLPLSIGEILYARRYLFFKSWLARLSKNAGYMSIHTSASHDASTSAEASQLPISNNNVLSTRSK